MTNLFLNIDRESNTSLHKQLIVHLKDHVLSGDIKKGEKLPSSRALSIDLKVSRIVTLAAYEQLIAEGYLISKAGSGTYVSYNIPDLAIKTTKKYAGPKWFTTEPAIGLATNKEVKYDFTIGRPANTLLSEADYKRSYRKALARPFVSERTAPSGVQMLKQEIAVFLDRSRNIKCHPEQIIITTGAAESLRLISKATEEFSPITYYENPGFQIGQHWLSQGLHNIKPIEIDKDGLMTKGLPKKTDQPSMLFCTPSHQFPLGFRLSLKRRNDILKWASENDALILEDDYDSEFHYDSMPLPTLKSQDETGQVLYFSSFSKSISPNVKIGYLIAPNNICAVINNIIHREHAAPPTLTQYALAYFIRDGSLDKHIAKSRRHYAKLNKIMREKLANLPDDINVSGLDSGIHAFLSFKQRPTKLLESLNRKSIYLPILEDNDKWHGFSIGYGHFEEKELKNSLDIITSEIKKLYPEL
ncbi:MAG: PLP-dependent aminotransferase family protein [Kordiimonadaceae bacterium]|jgi:GntR family transcriptional regulator / MocR family aminotransferase|nr:PLP-dependent aminotransferase family protein [Kordiimonadaceae bacterium]